MVDDQSRALAFYTEKLGFVKKHDIPLGAFRWLTVVSPEGAHGVELLLEPTGHPAAAPFQKALFDSNIPATSFGSDNVQAEFERLSQKGVVFASRRQRWARHHCRVRRYVRQPHPDRARRIRQRGQEWA